MIIYKGESLKEMIKDKKSEIMSSTGSDKIYERDFVNDIREVYFNSEPKYVMIINGLHGTGKTFGILQAVEDLDNILYVCAQENDGTTADDYIELLKNSEEDHIIIDEYSLINDRYDLDCCLWMLVKNSNIFDKLEDTLANIDIGGRYVVSGTDQEKIDVYNGNPVIFTSLEYSTIKNYRDFNENYERIKNTAVYT